MFIETAPRMLGPNNWMWWGARALATFLLHIAIFALELYLYSLHTGVPTILHYCVWLNILVDLDMIQIIKKVLFVRSHGLPCTFISRFPIWKVCKKISINHNKHFKIRKTYMQCSPVNCSQGHWGNTDCGLTIQFKHMSNMEKVYLTLC